MGAFSELARCVERIGIVVMRLLWLIDSLTIGGAESLIVPFARRAPYELTVCCLTTIAGNPIEQELRAIGIEVVNLGARNLRDRAAFRRLVTCVRQHHVDLVHAHLTDAAIWSALLSRRMKIPSIATLHASPTATRAQQAHRRHRLMTSLRDRLMRFVLRRWSSRVLTVSDALARVYRKLDPVTVHNGIDCERFAQEPAATRDPLRPPTVATVSVLRPAKGIEVLLEAARSVGGARFLIIGDGPMRAEWTRLAASLGIGDRIQWAGHRRDIEALLAGCDLFAYPTLDDAFPTVLLEAMAAGLPVVASDVGGVPEIVDDGVTGRLVPPGDAGRLAAAINELLAHPDSMGEAGRARVRREFSTEAWIARLDCVYREVLA
jgi:glycosyltransferase involved in cell wall biosynthesis